MTTTQYHRADRLSEGCEDHDFGTDAKGRARGARVYYYLLVVAEGAPAPGRLGVYSGMVAGTYFMICAQPTRDGRDWQASTTKWWTTAEARIEGVAQYLRAASKRALR